MERAACGRGNGKARRHAQSRSRCRRQAGALEADHGGIAVADRIVLTKTDLAEGTVIIARVILGTPEILYEKLPDAVEERQEDGSLRRVQNAAKWQAQLRRDVDRHYDSKRYLPPRIAPTRFDGRARADPSAVRQPSRNE